MKVERLLVSGSRTTGSADCVLREGDGSLAVYEVDTPVAPQLASRAVAVRSNDDYVGPRQHDSVIRFCRRFLSEWTTVSGEDLSEWRGVSLAHAMAGFPMAWTLVPTLVNVFAARAALSELSPGELLLGDGVGLVPDVWGAEATRMGIPCRRLEHDPLDEPEQAAAPRASLAERLTSVAYRAKQSFNEFLARAPMAVRPRHRVLAASRRDDRIDLGMLGIRPRLDRSWKIRPVYLDDRFVRRIRERVYPGALGAARSEMVERWQKLREELMSTDSVLCVDARSLWPVLERWLEELFTVRAAELAATVDVAHETLRELRPRLLVTKLAFGEERAAWCLTARRLGVPVVAGQREYYVPGINEYLPDAPADWVLAIGPSSIDWLEGHGVPKDRVVVVGDHSRREFALGNLAVDPSGTRTLMRLPNKPIVLFADAHFCGTSAVDSPIFYARSLDAVTEAARAMPDALFVVRFHPGGQHREGPGHIQRRLHRLADRPPNLLIASDESDMRPYLASAEVLVADTSTAAFEAMALNLPVVLLRPEIFDDCPVVLADATGVRLPGPNEAPAAVGLTSLADLVPALRAILDRPTEWRAALARGGRAAWAAKFGPLRDPTVAIEALAAGRHIETAAARPPTHIPAASTWR